MVPWSRQQQDDTTDNNTDSLSRRIFLSLLLLLSGCVVLVGRRVLETVTLYVVRKRVWPTTQKSSFPCLGCSDVALAGHVFEFFRFQFLVVFSRLTIDGEC